MNAFAARFEQARDGILRQPIDLQVRMQLAQLTRDRDVAAPVPEPDRGREIENFFGPGCPRARQPARGGDAKPAVEEVDDQRVGFCRKAAERVVPTARDGCQLRAGDEAGPLP